MTEGNRDPGKDRSKKEFSFRLRHETNRGRVYEGNFTNRILSNGQRLQVKALAARYRDNAPISSIDRAAFAFSEALAHVSVSLDPEDLPAWAEDLEALFDESVIYALYEEVAQHEAIFHGRAADPGAGDSEGAEGEG